MSDLSKKAEIMKFGCMKLNDTTDKMFQIMKENFGPDNFYIMDKDCFEKMSPDLEFMIDSLMVFLQNTITHSFL